VINYNYTAFVDNAKEQALAPA